MSDEHARMVYRQLQALARAQYGGNTGALLVVYTVEGFLRRLVASPHAMAMTLKGGMLMAATSARRMTKDADLATVGIAHEQARVAEVVGEVVPTALADDDGLTSDAASIRYLRHRLTLMLARRVVGYLSRGVTAVRRSHRGRGQRSFGRLPGGAVTGVLYADPCRACPADQ